MAPVLATGLDPRRRRQKKVSDTFFVSRATKKGV